MNLVHRFARQAVMTNLYDHALLCYPSIFFLGCWIALAMRPTTELVQQLHVGRTGLTSGMAETPNVWMDCSQFRQQDGKVMVQVDKLNDDYPPLALSLRHC